MVSDSCQSDNTCCCWPTQMVKDAQPTSTLQTAGSLFGCFQALHGIRWLSFFEPQSEMRVYFWLMGVGCCSDNTHVGPLGRNEIHQTARAVMSELIGWHINMRNTLKQDIPTYYNLSEGNISSPIICKSYFKTGTHTASKSTGIHIDTDLQRNIAG